MGNELDSLRRKTDALEKECRKLEESLLEREERFKKVFHASSNLIAITNLKDGRIVDVNEASAAFGGFKREELKGASASKLKLWVDPKQRERVIQALLEERSVQNLNVSLHSKNGDIRRVLFSADPITINEEPCMLSVCIDITEKENEADVLRQSEEKYRMLVENSLQGLAIIQNERIAFCNNAFAETCGYSVEELMSLPDTKSIIHPDDREAVVTRHHERLSGKSVPRRYEYRIVRKDGSSRWLEAYASRIVYNGQAAAQIVQLDVTESKNLETQLLQAQKMEAIGILAGGVAHDFNNLLNVINGYSELLLGDMEENNPIREDIEQIHQAGQRAANLTSQLLAFSRKQILHAQTLELNTVISQMSTMLQRLIREDIEFVFIKHTDLKSIYADPVQIQQIIMNLAVNARDAMPTGGKLTIETANVEFDENYIQEHPVAKPGRYVMMAISDNGTGMEADARSHLFEPFYTTKERGKGTGLGLATVYGIVKQSNGFIWVYSEPGKGTTFKIYFPEKDGEVPESATGLKSRLGFRGSETLLIVEDEEAVRTLAGRILKDRGYTVLEARDDKEALRMAKEYPGEIHMVITDVVMPGMGGTKLVAALELERPKIKALFISGYTDNAIVHHGILDSNVAFLQKPFTVEGLAQKTRNVLDS